MSLKKEGVPISLEHQPMLSALWKPLRASQEIHFAEYSFAHVFLFRRRQNYMFIEAETPFVRGVLGKFDAGQDYLIPTCIPEQFKLENLKSLAEEPISLFPIPDQWLKSVQLLEADIASFRADSDYLFHADKLKELGGRALSSRRNLLNQLKAHYTLESKSLTLKEMPDALMILETWQKQLGLPHDKTDYLPCRDALDYLELLELFGRIVYANGEPVGFVIGELLTPTTAVLRFAKSLRSVKGVTPFLYQDCALHLPESVQWINLEEDMGIASLRQGKKAYAPDLLLTKWRVSVATSS